MEKEYNIKIDASFFCDKNFVISAPNEEIAKVRVMKLLHNEYREPMRNRFVDMIEDHVDVGHWTYSLSPVFDIVYCEEEEEEEDVTFDSVDLELACLIDDPDENWQAEVAKIRARLWALQKKMGV
jgi:hypothetical protein